MDVDVPPEEEEEMSSIMELPEEVRGVIFNKLPQKETLNIRLVCRQWNLDIDNYFDFEIKRLDETSSYFKKILQLRIKSLEVFRLSETPIMDDEGVSIFLHPALIQKLIIPFPKPTAEDISKEAMELPEARSISPKNLQILLEMCAKHLEYLSLDLSPPVSTYQFTSDVGYDFEMLKSLDVSLQSQNFFTSETSPNTNDMILQLHNSSMTKLKSLKADFNFSGYLRTAKSRFIKQMLQLVVKHGRDLETLWLELDNGPPLEQELDILQPNELTDLKKLDKLQDVYLKMKPTGLLATAGVWQELICNQKHAVIVKMDTKFDGNVPLSQVPVTFLRNLVLNNEATLVSLDIESFTLPADDPPFDMSCFQNCRRLESLWLRRKKFVDRTVPDTPDIINFACLPETLVRLSLFGFKILSEKLYSTFSDVSKFSRMEQLSLSFCGEEGSLGFTGNVLDSIVTIDRPCLKEVYICRGINFDHLEGREKLEEILTSFKYDLSINRFLIRRATAHEPWTALSV